MGETLRIARLRVKELEAETNLQQTELNRLKEYVNASETAGRTLYGQQVDDLKQASASLGLSCLALFCGVDALSRFCTQHISNTEGEDLLHTV